MQSEHPASESEKVIQRGRVLGGLEPTRAFGDARYKWDRELQGRLYDAFLPGGRNGTRGPPRGLETPPYVTATPVVECAQSRRDQLESEQRASLHHHGYRWSLGYDEQRRSCQPRRWSLGRYQGYYSIVRIAEPHVPAYRQAALASVHRFCSRLPSIDCHCYRINLSSPHSPLALTVRLKTHPSDQHLQTSNENSQPPNNTPFERTRDFANIPIPRRQPFDPSHP